MTLTNLIAGTNYQYKAFVTESGEERVGDVAEFTTKKVATATVVTNDATEITTSGATLHGSFSGATGLVYETGFLFGTSQNNLAELEELKGDGGNMTSGSFSVSVTSLEPNRTYYYKAYILEFNENTNQYEMRVSSTVKSFTTPAYVPTVQPEWLEMPAISNNWDFVGRFYGEGGNTGPNRNYSYYYDYTYYASLWVAYPLCGTHKNGSASTSNWRYNPNIPTTPTNRQVKVRTSDGSYTTMYGDDTYSRGHQCPNADRKSDQTMNTQTYYVTNQTPQRQQHFNASIWGALENAERAMVSSATDTVYVITGPVYRKVGESETVNYLHGASGKNASPQDLPIPNYYWKAFLKVKRNGVGVVTDAAAIGFWFEHRDYTSLESFDHFAVSIDQIEQWTGFDLFVNLPDAIETAVEANSSWSSFTSSAGIASVFENNWGTL